MTECSCDCGPGFGCDVHPVLVDENDPRSVLAAEARKAQAALLGG